jgi:two-component system sensor histidine kinase KdpD
LVAEEDPVPVLLERLRASFDLDRTELQVASAGGWTTELFADRGETDTPAAPRDDGDGTSAEPVAPTPLPLDATTRLVLTGRTLTGDDQRVLRAFVAQLGAALERRELQHEAAQAAIVSEGDALRTALLRSVSHDLRTPLASIKASVTSLLQDDVDWPPEARAEFLATIDEESDRLDRLVGNLLDMSRLQSGAVRVHRRKVAWEEVVAGAIASLSNPDGAIDLHVPETLPTVDADPALLERVVANLVSNALRYSPPGVPVRIEGGEVADRVELRVIDRGPGVAKSERERIFQPFQRLGDDQHTGNLGLGLAVAHGFVEVMGGQLDLENTPGGGATMVIRMKAGASTRAGAGTRAPA